MTAHNHGPNAWPERFILVADELSATTLPELPQDRFSGRCQRDGAANSPFCNHGTCAGIPTVWARIFSNGAASSDADRRWFIAVNCWSIREPVLLQEYQR